MSCKYDHEYPVWCYREIEECRTHDKADYCPYCGSPLSDPTPLSLDQLRGMDGEPVWVEDLVCQDFSKWYVVELKNWKHTFVNFGITWLAYTHKPKDQEG